MASTPVGGAFLGALFQELLKAVQDVVVKAVMFKSILKRIELILNQITPMIEEIEEDDKLIDRHKDEIEMFKKQLKQGLKLVQKCTKIKWGKLNCVLMPYYASRLEGFEDSLVKFCQIDVQLRIAKDSGKNLLHINEIRASLSRLETGVVGFGGIGAIEGFRGCCGVPGAPEFVVGFEEPLEELKREVIEGKEKVLVVSAPGGCGKTTLVKMVCHDKDIKGIFRENIFFVTFSKTPNLKVIIKYMLHHKGYSNPEFQTDEEAFNRLEQMLQQMGSRPVLVVLDDVWPGSESYIENFQFDIPDYKILVTSRSIFPRFSPHKLKLLTDQDAKKLFLHSAFPQGESSRISVDIVNEMVKRCGGFPLALTVVGRSLCGQDKVMWKRRLNQWYKGQSIFCSNNDLLICLQSSIDALDGGDNLKECYLDLASFPEDQSVPVTTLVDMWAELYDLDEDGEDAIANLYMLAHRNLVNLVVRRKDASENGYYNEHFVTQHDILREFAIHHSEQNRIDQRERLAVDVKGSVFPKWWIEQRQHPTSAQLVSISADGPISNWWNMDMPNAKVLVLNIRAESEALPQFMDKINYLKALIITNNHLRSAEISNFSVLGHLQNLKRIRLEHITINSVSNSFLQLKNLHKLSLVMCKVDEAFKECTIQVPDMPNLVEIVIDYCSDLVELPKWLCNICSLKKISITNCHDLISLSEEFGKLENLEILRLSSCTNLSELPKAIGDIRKLHFLDLSDCIRIASLPEGMGELCGLRKLNMRGCEGLTELPVSVKELKHLESVICDHERSYLWEEYKINLPDLELEVIEDEPNLDWLH